MRNRAAAVLLWLAATVAATLLVSAGVGAIRDTTRADELVARPPATTSGDPAPNGATTSTTTVTAPQPSTTGPPSVVVPGTTPPGTTPSGTTPSGTTPPGTTPPGTTPPGTTPPPPPTPPTSAPAAEPVTLTIPSEGGSATIRFGPDAVTVVAATPAAGYAAKVSPQGATAVRVEFENEDRRSRIDASWDGGPVTDVRED